MFVRGAHKPRSGPRREGRVPQNDQYCGSIQQPANFAVQFPVRPRSPIMSLSRLRWILWHPGAPEFNGAQELVQIPCRRAALRAAGQSTPHSLYVSCHKPIEAWLTVIIDSSWAKSFALKLEPAFNPYSRRHDHTSDPAVEPLLLPTCADFRKDIDAWSHIALDLLEVPDLVATRIELIRATRGRRSERPALEPLLLRLSSTYRQLDHKDGLWERATKACIPSTDAIHWLFNVFLGHDDWNGTASEEQFRTWVES